MFALCAILALLLLAIWQADVQVETRIRQGAERAAATLDQHAERVLSEYLASLEQLEWAVEDVGLTEAISSFRLHERLRAFKEARPEVQSVWLFDAAGDVLSTSIGFPPPDVNFADREYFQAALRGESRFIGRVILGRVTGEHSFSLSKRITAADGQLVGVAVLSIYPEAFRQFYASVGPEADSVALVREDGALLARHPVPEGDLSTLTAPAGFMDRLRGDSKGALRGAAPFGKGERLFAYRRLAKLPLYVLYGVSAERIAAEQRRLAGVFALLAGPALLGVALFGWTAHRQAARADRLRDGLERRVVERTRALSESEARLQAALGQMPVGVALAEIPSGAVVYCNGKAAELFGPQALAIAGLADYDRFGSLHGDLSPCPAEEHPLARAVLRRETVDEAEILLRRENGALVHLSVSAAPIRGPDGRAELAIATFSDITGRRADERRQLTLLSELDHRVKNILAVVQAIAQQSLGGDERSAAFGGRLRALARAHSILSRRKWRGVTLREIVERALEPHADGPTRTEVEGPELALTARAAQSLTLAFHELTTNAAKYGALSCEGGHVSVRWRVEQDEAGRPRLRLRWSESGGPLVSQPTRRGFGAQLSVGEIEHGLLGEAAFDYAPEGLRFDASVPLAEIEDREQPSFRSVA